MKMTTVPKTTFASLTARFACGCLVAFMLVGCSSPKRTIRIPESVVPNPKNKGSEKVASDRPYVIKMSDGKRTIQLEIPADKTKRAYSTAIPLNIDELESAPSREMTQTEADREINDAKAAAGEKIPETAPGEEPKARSYLATLARVGDLYKRRQYEIALIELTALDREYPDDERILSMKGTLYWKLKRPKQAREAWERVLALNPENAQVAQALEQLGQDGE
jgi:predicted RNA polymerase sigma factor